MIAVIDRALAVLITVARALILTATLGIFIIVLVAVFLRYVLGTSVSWSEEVPRYLLIWISFAGAAVGVARKEHIAFDLVYGALPPIPRRILGVLLNLLVLGFGWIMLRYGIVFVEDFGSDLMETIPYTNYWYYLAMPVTGALIMMFALQALLHTLVDRGAPSELGAEAGPRGVGVD